MPKRMIERKKGRRRDIEREGEIREIERGERDRESERARKILVKSPKPRNKAQRKFDYKNYDAITMRRNYEEKLLQENDQLVYYDAENLGIKGILAYPKTVLLHLIKNINSSISH